MNPGEQEMNERKMLRKQREQERQQKQRKALLRKLIAFGSLVLFVIVILMIRSCQDAALEAPPTEASTGETVGQETPENQESQPSETVETEPSAKTTVIHFAAAGDLNITDQVVAAGGAELNYTQAFMDVLPLLSQADLTALNFEGNVCGAPYGKDSAPQQLLDALKLAGVDLLQLANSKSINRGVSGLNSTVRNVRAAGMASVGAVAEGETPGAYVIRYVNGVKVAVVAFTKGMDGMQMPAGSEDLVNILYTDYATTYKKVDTDGITSLLRQVQGEEPDITIALLHWGSEYSDIHSETQETIRKLLVKEGVDAIIGSHPHFVQRMDYDAETGVFVAYSLGDFFGDAPRTGTDYSVVLDLEITKDNTTGITKITGYSYTPIYTVRDDTGHLRVVRLHGAIDAYNAGRIGKVSKETYQNMLYGLERLEKRIHPDPEA